MAVNLSPVGGVAAQFFTSTGAVLTGGKLYTYAAGTTTPAVTYTTSQGNVPWTNPVVLDAAGRVPGSGEIWLTDGIIYKFVLKDSNDVLIATYDNITGINSNAVAYTNQQEIVTATAGQTVFNLGISYAPGTNSLSVFVDGVNQYGPGAQYAYTETSSTSVTFNSGLHVGAEVKFTTTQQQGAGAVDASQVTYDPPFTGSVATNVEAKLAQTVSVFDFMSASEIADVQSGTPTIDVSAAIQAALDTKLSVYFPPGVYGLTTGITLAMAGQRIYGAGPFNNMVPSQISGSRLKRISGTANPLISVVGDNGIFEGFSFDNNDASNAVCVKITSHGLTVRDFDFYNQAGGEVSLWLDSVNTSNYYNITAVNMRITETLYTNFYGIGLVGGLAGNVLYINGQASAGANGCQNLNFFGVFLENSNNTSSVRIDDNVTNVHFYGVRGEIGSTMATALFDINGDKNGTGVYLARNITIDGFTFGITTGALGDAVPYFKVSNAQNITIKNAYFKDTFSSAGLNYIVLDDVKYFSVEDCFAYASNAFNFVSCVSSCVYLSAKNCNQFDVSVGTMLWQGTYINVENTNMAQAFSTSGDAVTMTNVSGAINLANSTSQTLVNCSNPTNLPSNGSVTIINNGMVRSNIASVASANNLNLTSSGENFLVTGTTQITSITGGGTIIGRKVVLQFAGSLTVKDLNNLKLNGDFATSAGSTLTLFCDGTDWYEQARSIN
jgi:hypothetical protein